MLHGRTRQYIHGYNGVLTPMHQHQLYNDRGAGFLIQDSNSGFHRITTTQGNSKTRSNTGERLTEIITGR